MQRVALGLGGVLIAVALGIGIPALMTHARERAAWAAERAEQGTDDYDPRVSDRHYRASRDAWQRSAPAGHLMGAGVLLFVIGAVRRRTSRSDSEHRTPTDDSENREPTTDDRRPSADSAHREPNTDPGRVRVASACAIDVTLGAAILALHWLDAGESAAIRALAGAAPWLAALPFAPLVSGATVGMRALDLHTTAGPRALIAIALWPLASLGGFNLRIAGLEVTRDGR